jgi:lysophospholipase L1-like esterase
VPHPPPEKRDGACRLGVLAFGDSITNAGGDIQYGVALQSWALWTARGLGLPYSPYAVDGALVSDVVTRQIPLFERVARAADGRYELGCLYIGTNDVRALDWDPGAFARDFETALGWLAARCERTLTLTVRRDLGRPRVAAARLAEVNGAIEAGAARHGALVVDLREFGARNLMMADHVHPTAFGQIAIAERALDGLAASGMPVALRPRELIVFDPGRRERLLGDLAYTYRHAKVSARAGLIGLGVLAG